MSHQNSPHHPSDPALVLSRTSSKCYPTSRPLPHPPPPPPPPPHPTLTLRPTTPQLDKLYDRKLEDDLVGFSQWLTSSPDKSTKTLSPLSSLSLRPLPDSPFSTPQTPIATSLPSHPELIVTNGNYLKYQYISSRTEVKKMFKEKRNKEEYQRIFDEDLIKLGRKIMVAKLKKEGLWDGGEEDKEKVQARRKFYGDEE